MSKQIIISIIGTVGVPACYGGFESLVENLLDYTPENVQYTVFCTSKKYSEKLESYKGAKLVYLDLDANGMDSIMYDYKSMKMSLDADIMLVLGVSGCMFLPFIRKKFKGKIINVYKLRSMTNECDEDGNLLPDEVRLKTWGKIIRKTNLDEIPQVFNLLKGEISLIGPRPLKKNEMVVMSEAEQALRQSVLPGISGWEAVNEGKTSTRREMAEYDLYYVNNWSLWLDIKIFFLTIYVIFCNARPEDEYRAPKIDDEPELNIEKETVTK